MGGRLAGPAGSSTDRSATALLETNGHDGLIDADTHVVEHSGTWDNLDPALRDMRPLPISIDEPGSRKLWLVGGQRLPRALGNESMPNEVREMRDVPSRVRAMDALGVELQVLHPTFFLMTQFYRPDVEWALVRAYNRWMADVWTGAGWLQVVRDGADAKPRSGRGRAGVRAAQRRLRGADAGSRELSCAHRPLLGSAYAIAQDRDLTICIHVGSDNPMVYQRTFESRGRPRGQNIFTILPAIGGFYSLLVGDVSERFRRLRFAFWRQARSGSRSRRGKRCVKPGCRTIRWRRSACTWPARRTTTCRRSWPMRARAIS